MDDVKSSTGGSASGKNKPADDRARNWNIIVYPDSAPSNWRDILNDQNIAWIESPLHDKDENPDGEPKKPHWHILVIYEGKQSYETVLKLTQQLNTVPPQRCKAAKGSVRYMVHMDNPEKYQYDVKDIKTYGGADVKKYLTLTAGDKYQCIKEMCLWCKQNEITEYQDLVDFAMIERTDDWFIILCDCGTMVMSNYIKSLRHSKKEVNPETGEYPHRFIYQDGQMIDTKTGDILKG